MADKSDRGITSLKAKGEPFMYKGSIIAGGSLAVSTYSMDNFGIAVVEGINTGGYKLSIRPDVMYALSDDLAIGISLGYDRIKLDLRSAAVSVENISLKLEDYNTITHDMGGAFFCRKYLTLGRSGRCAIYVDASLSMSGGQSKVSVKDNGDIVGTYQSSYKIGLSINPGLAAWLTPRFALSAGLGILGIQGNWTNQVHNQIATGVRDGFSASYMLNPLSLSVGVYYRF